LATPQLPSLGFQQNSGPERCALGIFGKWKSIQGVSRSYLLGWVGLVWFNEFNVAGWLNSGAFGRCLALSGWGMLCAASTTSHRACYNGCHEILEAKSASHGMLRC